MTRGKWWGAAAAAAAAALVVALAVGCGSNSKGGGPTGPTIDHVPESWRGVWKLNVSGSYCDLPIPIYEDSLVENLCPGDSIQFGLPIDLGGTGCDNGAVTATETSLSFSCSGPYSEGGCTGTINANFSITINATTGKMSGSGRVNVQFTSGGDCPTNYCIELTMTGDRISTTPNCPVNATKESFLTEALEKIRSQR
jgi:hypothetical protein